MNQRGEGPAPRVTFRLERELLELLKARADKKEMSVSEVVRDALCYYLYDKS